VKRTFILLALSVCLICQASAQEKSNREEDGLRGLVKSVRIECSVFEKRLAKWIEGRREIQTVEKYDLGGNLIESAHYNQGVLERKFVSTFDGRGHLIETRTDESQAEFSTQSLPRYNDQGRLVEEFLYDSKGSLLVRSGYSYDDRNNQTAAIHYDGKGALNCRIDFTYDLEDRLVGVLCYVAEGGRASREFNEYDSIGRKVLEAHYGQNNSLASKRVYHYDTSGNQAGSALYDADGSLIAKTISVFDNRGNEIETATYEDDHLKWREVRRFEFDSMGNWIKETATKFTAKTNGAYSKHIQVKYRTITYY